MIETSNKAKKLVSYKNVEQKLILNLESNFSFYSVIKQLWEELKASLMIAYPNCEGLGEWEPAQMIFKDQYEWANINTDQIDV